MHVIDKLEIVHFHVLEGAVMILGKMILRAKIATASLASETHVRIHPAFLAFQDAHLNCNETKCLCEKPIID